MATTATTALATESNQSKRDTFIIKWQKQPHQQVLEFHTVLQWPTSTKACCYNCCHPFDGVPVPLPYSFDPNKGEYVCRGNFCSWQCAKAYNIQNTLVTGRGDRNMYIALLAYKTWYKLTTQTRPVADHETGALKTYAYTCIRPAPSRENLQMFGGCQRNTAEDFTVFCPQLRRSYIHPSFPSASVKKKAGTEGRYNPLVSCFLLATVSRKTLLFPKNSLSSPSTRPINT